MIRGRLLLLAIDARCPSLLSDTFFNQVKPYLYKLYGNVLVGFPGYRFAI